MVDGDTLPSMDSDPSDTSDSDSELERSTTAYLLDEEAEGFALTLDGDVSEEMSPGLQALIEAKVRKRLFAQPGPARIGRFTVLEEIGRGGMGVVFAAYDEQLDRKVAVKVMLAEHSGIEARHRFQREAQAMARLSHPNVVTVHEVGKSDDQVYLAMEFIRGQSLDVWLSTKPDWRQVLEVLVQAGRGLMAAHEVGLVHRDLKPHNIMRSEDGTVKVLDFGLARAQSDAPDEPADEDELLGSSSILASSLTATGALVGTPAYMAPEQFEAGTPDARSDQFSFCVVFYEALLGERPYETTSHELSGMSMSRSTTRLPRFSGPGARIPWWLHGTLLRGLEPDPGDRWPSMAALLKALERGRRRLRWHRTLGGAAAIAVSVGAVLVVQQQRANEHDERVSACEAEGTTIDEIWNDAERARIREGLLATGAGFAQQSIDTLTPWLDDYRDAWHSGRIEACRHGMVEHDWDEQLLDRSAWCFEDRRLQLEATIEQLATATPKAARRAVRLASYLDPVKTCLDPTLLRRLPTPPAEVRAEVRAIRAILSESDQLRHAGHYARALQVARQAVERTEPLGWPPLLANARFIEGRCLRGVGRYTEADTVLTRAYFEAQAAGTAEVAFRAARSLMVVLANLQRYREAEIWARHAEVLSFGLTDPSGLDEAEGHYLLIEIYRGLGDYESAAEQGARALTMRTEALGADHPITASAMRSLGRIHLLQERPLEALELFERSFAIWEDAVGHEHPYIGDLAMLRGRALFAIGRVDEALVLLEEGLAVHQRVLRPDHPTLADDLAQLGRVYVDLGRLDEAERLYRDAMTIWRSQTGLRARVVAQGQLNMSVIDRLRDHDQTALERCEQALELLEGTLEPSHPDIAAALEHMADVYQDMGSIEEAIGQRREALARRESTAGPASRQLITPLVRLGDLLRARARLAEARRAYERALTIGEQGLDDADCMLVPSLVGLAEVALEHGDAPLASDRAERAVRIAERHQCGPRVAAGAHWVLARALGASSDPEPRARAIAEQAHAEYTTAHDGVGRAAVEGWLMQPRVRAQTHVSQIRIRSSTESGDSDAQPPHPHHR